MSLFVLLSGYGPFLNIKQNPADELGKIISSNFHETFENTNIKLLTYESLEVTPHAVETMIQHWLNIINDIRQREPNSKFLSINIGVDQNIEERVMHFERYCFNGRCFDKNSDLTSHDIQVYEQYPLNHRIECKFDIEGIVNSLKPYNPFFKISYNPGTYLCGYVFLRSCVELSNDHDTHNFFCHIPDGFDD